MKIMKAKDVSSQRRGLVNRAYCEEYKQERLESELWIHIKPTTIARLKLSE